MNVEVRDFLTEIQTAPAFGAAAAANPIFDEHLENIERGLQALYQDGGADPWAVELFDRVRAAVGSKTPLKQRLAQLEGLLREWQARHNRSKQ